MTDEAAVTRILTGLDRLEADSSPRIDLIEIAQEQSAFTERADRLRVAAAARSLHATARAGWAVRDLHHRGVEVNFAASPRSRAVSRQFLYTHPELRGEIERLRGERRTPLSRTPPSSLQATHRSAPGSGLHSTTTNGCERRTPGCKTNWPSHTDALASAKPISAPPDAHRTCRILPDYHQHAA